MIKFTPKKFIAMLELNNTNLTNLINTDAKIYRSFFIPRYKGGSKRIKDLDFDYSKKISSESIEKIFYGLVELGIVELTDKEMVDGCFKNNNFDALLPKDLL
jgi:hypothetical protein